MRRRTKRRVLSLLLVVLVVVAYRFARDPLLDFFGRSPAPPDKGEQLRVVSWNLRNFPSTEHDLPLLREELARIDADVLALQEIHDPQALAELLPGFHVRTSETGGRLGQRLAIAWNPTHFELLEEPREHRQLSANGAVRPAYSAYLRARPNGPDFHLVVVHLKAMADGYPLRQKQWRELAHIVDGLGPDTDVLLVGDFNTTGPVGGRREQELDALIAALAPAGLRHASVRSGCSAYWDGPRRDAWKEPSWLDHVFVGSLDESISPTAEVSPYGACSRHGCAAFRSTEAYPDPMYHGLSDHCPLVVDLAPFDDD